MLEWTDNVSLEKPPDDLVLQDSQSDEEYAGERDSMSGLSVVALLWREGVTVEMLLQNGAH